MNGARSIIRRLLGLAPRDHAAGAASPRGGESDASHAILPCCESAADLAPTETDIAMMRRAIEQAMRGEAEGEIPVGAVVYETATGRLLAEAHNRREANADPAGHAELLAIREAAARVGDWRLNHCTLVVTLEPCVMCAGLIVNARVGRLVYGAADPKAGAVRSLHRLCEDERLNHRVAPVTGVLEEECGDMLRRFFRSRRGKSSPPGSTG